jgi:hypothetical protein
MYVLLLCNTSPIHTDAMEASCCCVVAAAAAELAARCLLIFTELPTHSTDPAITDWCATLLLQLLLHLCC